MPLPTDPRLGPSYVDACEFVAMASAYGAQQAVDALGDNAEAVIGQLGAIASRTIEAYLANWGINPDSTFTENHKFDYKSPRIFPNNRPLIDLLGFKIRVANQTTVTFPLTPVVNAADNIPQSWGSIYYNRQENYLEVTSLQLQGGVILFAGGFASIPVAYWGLQVAQAEIQYKSASSVDPVIVAAASYQVAKLLNENHLSNTVNPAIESMATPKFKATYRAPQSVGRASSGASAHLHPMVEVLLAPLKRIPIA